MFFNEWNRQRSAELRNILGLEKVGTADDMALTNWRDSTELDLLS